MKSPRANFFHFSLYNQGFAHFKSLYKSLSSWWYCRRSFPTTSNFCLKYHVPSYCHYMKTCEIQLSFLSLVSACLWVTVSCVYMLSFVTLQFDLVNEKMQFYVDGYLGIIKFASENQAWIHGQGSALISPLLVSSQQDSTASVGPIVFSERAQWEGLACTSQPPPSICILSL